MKPYQNLTKRGQVARLKWLAEEALCDYDIGETTLISLEHMANTTFRVDAADGQRYVIRIVNPSDTVTLPRRTEDQVRSEMEWLAALERDTDLVVPAPVRTLDGKLLTKAGAEGVPEERTCALFRWVEGRFIDDGLTPRHIEQVGILTARLHEHASKQFGSPEGFTRPKPDNLSTEIVNGIIKTFAEVRPREDVKIVEAVIEKVQRVLDSLGTGPDVFGLIHADLHQSNYLFHKSEIRAIDFDDCGQAHFLYDLTVTLSELKHKQDYPQLRAVLLSGYRTVRPLPSEHESYLDTLIAFRELQLATWFIDQRHHPAFKRWEEDAERGLEKMKVLAGV